MPDYGWNPTANRYVDLSTGRFVSSSAVRDALEDVMSNSKAKMNAITQQLIDGSISLSSWQSEMMSLVKVSHVAAASSANGGWAQMTQSDWGFTGSLIKDQYAYLRNFAAELADGTQALDGRALVRADMYGEASRDTYEAMRFRNAEAMGAEEEIRELGAADHCSGCLEQAALGWQPIGTLEEIGAMECLTRCHCTKKFRRMIEGGEWEEFE